MLFRSDALSPAEAAANLAFGLLLNPERAARLIHERKMGPVIIVFPDCFTALGGNQYVNSPAIGNYADYLTREIIPFVDRQFRTLASREHRGCFGKSSGGYGVRSLVRALVESDLFLNK